MKRKRKTQKPSTRKVVIVRKKAPGKKWVQNHEKAVIVRKPALPKPAKAKVVSKPKAAAPAPKKKKIKTPPNKKKVSPVENIPFYFRKYVYKMIEEIMPPVPWKIGIKADLIKRILYRREFAGKRTRVRRLCEAKLSKMVYDDEYLNALINGRHRHGFGGYTERILPKHRRAAAKELELKRKRRQRRLDKKAS